MTEQFWPIIESYEQALQFVYGRIDYERLQARDYTSDDLKLDRMRKLLEVLGNPQDQIPTIHVAGTKGKGSTCEIIASILQSTGKSVGLYTSPHVSRFEERIRISGLPLSRSEFVDQLKKILSKFDAEAHRELLEQATFFELTTALAWQSFQDRQVDCVVLEVGLGGRLDCTNICKPCMTVITRIGLDHTNVLGDTIAEIAREKAGIIKPGVHVVVSSQVPDAKRVIAETATRVGAPLNSLGREITFVRHKKKTNNQSIDVNLLNQKYQDIHVSLHGIHQCENAATAISAVLLSDFAECITIENIRDGMANVRLPLRMEIVSTKPAILLDAAHNPTAIQSLVASLNEFISSNNRILIFGGSKDKDIPTMVDCLASQFDTVIVTEYQTNPRAAPAEEIRKLFAAIKLPGKMYCISNPAAALRKAQRIAGDDSLICVTGSFFLAAELRELLVSEIPG